MFGNVELLLSVIVYHACGLTVSPLYVTPVSHRTCTGPCHPSVSLYHPCMSPLCPTGRVQGPATPLSHCITPVCRLCVPQDVYRALPPLCLTVSPLYVASVSHRTCTGPCHPSVSLYHPCMSPLCPIGRVQGPASPLSHCITPVCRLCVPQDVYRALLPLCLTVSPLYVTSVSHRTCTGPCCPSVSLYHPCMSPLCPTGRVQGPATPLSHCITPVCHLCVPQDVYRALPPLCLTVSPLYVTSVSHRTCTGPCCPSVSLYHPCMSPLCPTGRVQGPAAPLSHCITPVCRLCVPQDVYRALPPLCLTVSPLYVTSVSHRTCTGPC